jgi:hypothetical protein
MLFFFLSAYSILLENELLKTEGQKSQKMLGARTLVSSVSSTWSKKIPLAKPLFSWLTCSTSLLKPRVFLQNSSMKHKKTITALATVE